MRLFSLEGFGVALTSVYESLTGGVKKRRDALLSGAR